MTDRIKTLRNDFTTGLLRASRGGGAGLSLALLIVGSLGLLQKPAAAEIIHIGSGSYATEPPAKAGSPPTEIFQTENVHGKMPSNRWWSSLAWVKYSDKQYPHPLAVVAEAGGLRVSYPGAHITANSKGIFAAMQGKTEDLVVGHSAAEQFPDARVDGFSDWFVRARFGSTPQAMTVTYGHGSPFVYVIYEGGGARITCASIPKIWSGDEHSAVLGITLGDRHYALFGPTGSTWSNLGTKTLTNIAPGKNYFSLAILPDDAKATLELFRKYAYAHVTDTKVSWSYDPKTAAVATTFAFTTTPQEGTERGTLFALYPHQWRHTNAPLLAATYASVRGTMKLAEGTSFTTTMRFGGVLPALPRVEGVDPARIAAYMKDESSKDETAVHDTYWEGKWLGKQAALAPLAEQFGLSEDANHLADHVRRRLEDWLTAAGADGQPKTKGFFCYNERWGTLIGYPAGYGSDKELNDHHFHYGYFLRAAAEVARRDPKWAADDRWGPMVRLIVRDIANPDRADPQFPFLRNFDPYAGHSWASGHAKFADGNNQESSSEAMNAWYGLILWGQATSDTKLRDLGVWLYTTELAGVEEYWFDITGENFPKAFTMPALGMVWGGKGAYGTWFSGDAEAVQGINWLPIHAGSLYLGRDPKYADRSYQSLLAQRKGTNWKMWSDIIWMYRALSDPADATHQLESAGDAWKPEAGNSRAMTYDWIATLSALGQVDASITADYPLAVAFRRGAVRSYAAYNGGAAAISVRFSDGFELNVKPGSFALGDRKATAARE